MHTNRISLARKFLLALSAVAALLFFAGCQAVVLSNLTAPSLDENPSEIYTITLRVTPKISTIVSGSISAHIVIDGQDLAMTPSTLGENLFEYEYHLPAGRSEVAYYFLVKYAIEGNNGQTQGEEYTGITHAQIVRREVVKLSAIRGPVGARIALLGNGFTPQDVISFEGTAVRTVYESPNSLSFFVPAVPPGQNYRVLLNNSTGQSPVGIFRVDGSDLTISPTSLMLRTGEKQTITFTIPNLAPAGGLLLDVTTDVPESVIMPEVLVPQGQSSVTVTVEGGKPGTGSLYLKGYGTGEITVPVTVSGR